MIGKPGQLIRIPATVNDGYGNAASSFGAWITLKKADGTVLVNDVAMSQYPGTAGQAYYDWIIPPDGAGLYIATVRVAVDGHGPIANPCVILVEEDVTTAINSIKADVDAIMEPLTQIIRRYFPHTGTDPDPYVPMLSKSLNQLAQIAYTIYHPDGSDVAMYQVFIEAAWREFVHVCGGLYSRTVELVLTPGLNTYTLPADYRSMRDNGVFLYYDPKPISSISRAGGTAVVTLTEGHAHNLSVGVQIALVDAGEFAGIWTVTRVPNFMVFEFAMAGDDVSVEGGTVQATITAEKFLRYKKERDLSGSALWRTTRGTPEYYTFRDGSNVILSPVPDGISPTLTLRYDAEAPADLREDVDLPLPPYLQMGIVGHAIAKLAAYNGDDKRAAIGLVDYQTAVNEWQAALVERQQIGSDSWNE